jgi:hypothetical protein
MDTTLVLSGMPKAPEQEDYRRVKFFRVKAPGKCEWTAEYQHAKSIAAEWARAVVLNRADGSVTIDAINFTYRNYQHLLDVLSGLRPAERMYIIGIDKGVVKYEQEWKRKRMKVTLDVVDTVAHPTHRHADWIKTIHEIEEYQSIIRSAPDHKALMIAFKIAKIDTSISGYKITPALARYCWDWVNSAQGRV